MSARCRVLVSEMYSKPGHLGQCVSAAALVTALLVPVAVLPATAWAGDGRAAIQGADASCSSSDPVVYARCDNGTITDTRSGLVWLRDASCFLLSMDWSTAMEAVAALSDLPPSADSSCGGPADTCDCGLSDGSAPGEWRLPSVEEWLVLFGDAAILGCDPKITSDDGQNCWNSPLCASGTIDCSFTDVRSANYWTASPDPSDSTRAFIVNLSVGDYFFNDTTALSFVWPVRGGQ